MRAFDRYLRGERAALEPDEERGYELFKVYGCTACHQGVNVGGNLFQRFGIFHDPFAGARRRQPSRSRALCHHRQGRRSPCLPRTEPAQRRLTAPYFHDGRVVSLEEAVESMGRSQLGRSLSGQEIALIVAFLRTLTGEYQGRPLAPDSDS